MMTGIRGQIDQYLSQDTLMHMNRMEVHTHMHSRSGTALPYNIQWRDTIYVSLYCTRSREENLLMFNHLFQITVGGNRNLITELYLLNLLLLRICMLLNEINIWVCK